MFSRPSKVLSASNENTWEPFNACCEYESFTKSETAVCLKEKSSPAAKEGGNCKDRETGERLPVKFAG